MIDRRTFMSLLATAAVASRSNTMFWMGMVKL